MSINPQFRSNFERRVYAALIETGNSATYETMRLPYHIDHVYTPDLILPSGVVTELIGYMPTAKRTKLLAIKLAHPDLDLRLVFQDASNRISKLSKTTYGLWASRSGFIWCQGAIPLDWCIKDIS